MEKARELGYFILLSVTGKRALRWKGKVVDKSCGLWYMISVHLNII